MGEGSKEVKVSQFRLEKGGLEAFLGPLEVEVLNEIWALDRPSVTVREVYESLRRRREIAYTTVMSTMNILYEKGLLNRRLDKGKGGHFYVYWASKSQEELKQALVERVVSNIVKNFGETAIIYFLKEGGVDEEELKRLKRLVDEKVRSGNSGMVSHGGG
ncbi:MAG: BlaI/MecI/CopY family transcriptional regulator [Candidatus Methanomethylicia archaeon]|jgi:predicted transcriptional regulator|uniref:CopY family transcriptional regulator n=1 Tax=Candidatus Methanosuratincola petrocarbonis (ex Vanwonterghem et al. 2016) TaxID=1867261 RepID=A0A7J3UZC9_9CREN|nr:BlaI/MecI/CopY family transcriptional regulator [Candidatus Methanomethylicia archaeon]